MKRKSPTHDSKLSDAQLPTVFAESKEDPEPSISGGIPSPVAQLGPPARKARFVIQ